MTTESDARDSGPFESAYPLGEPGSAERRRYVEMCDRRYHPCDTGIHVCGVDDDADLPAGPHFTVANILLDEKSAWIAFSRFRAAFEVPDDEGDVLVDLRINGSTEHNFWMRRQMVERMEREALSEVMPT